MISVALPKGRLGRKVYDMLAGAGYDFPGMMSGSETRRLMFENEVNDMRAFWVRASDVPVYVERGVADIGICGKDVLMERNAAVYELCDLNAGKCSMCECAPRGFYDDCEKTLRVATEYPNITREYYSNIGRQIDIITLRGSVEIAPLLGLSDVIVDIVETGSTLRDNGLEVFAVIASLSARLIANKSSYKFNGEIIDRIIRGLSCDKNNVVI